MKKQPLSNQMILKNIYNKNREPINFNFGPYFNPYPQGLIYH